MSMVETYFIPDDVLTTKRDSIRNFEILDFSSDWEISGTSENSPDEAKEQTLANARFFGANGLVYFRYEKTTGKEPSYNGGGTYYYTIHNYIGTPVVFGKKSVDDTHLASEVSGLNKRIKAEKKRLKKYSFFRHIKRSTLVLLTSALMYIF